MRLATRIDFERITDHPMFHYFFAVFGERPLRPAVVVELLTPGERGFDMDFYQKVRREFGSALCSRARSLFRFVVEGARFRKRFGGRAGNRWRWQRATSNAGDGVEHAGAEHQQEQKYGGAAGRLVSYVAIGGSAHGLKHGN